MFLSVRTETLEVRNRSPECTVIPGSAVLSFAEMKFGILGGSFRSIS